VRVQLDGHEQRRRQYREVDRVNRIASVSEEKIPQEAGAAGPDAVDHIGQVRLVLVRLTTEPLVVRMSFDTFDEVLYLSDIYSAAITILRRSQRHKTVINWKV
jgi:hypothetical protein